MEGFSLAKAGFSGWFALDNLGVDAIGSPTSVFPSQKNILGRYPSLYNGALTTGSI